MSAGLQRFWNANAPYLQRAALQGFGEEDLAALAAMEMGARPLFQNKWRVKSEQQAQQLANLRGQLAILRAQAGGGGGGGMDEDPEMAGIFGTLMGDDDFGADDAEDLAAEDEEIGAIEGEEEDAIGDDGEEDFGASEVQLERKRDKLEAKLDRLTTKYNNTPKMKRRLRNELRTRIARVRTQLKRVNDKLPKKARAADKQGSRRSARARGGADRGVIERENIASTQPGNEVRIPFTDASTGSLVTVISVAAGSGLRTASISMETDPITYADFEIIGLDTDLKVTQANTTTGIPLGEALVNVLLSTVIPNGGLNLLYQTVNASFGAQTVGNQLSAARSIPGLRTGEKLRATNTATLTGTFRQEMTTTVALTATFQAALVCRVLRDDSVKRWNR